MSLGSVLLWQFCRFASAAIFQLRRYRAVTSVAVCVTSNQRQHAGQEWILADISERSSLHGDYLQAYLVPYSLRTKYEPTGRLEGPPGQWRSKEAAR
ncbi:hypothetical protein PoMZ_06442 [Pyricularia oryzae]|uniref:Secreted protein n=1 Tax=Pyricularia oryzae TaxID=318829 RepID=A0A4P7NQP0_PYROR|nr:hypothetical protein PoMZ_06442 [Pyricularia oryzae]